MQRLLSRRPKHWADGEIADLVKALASIAHESGAKARATSEIPPNEVRTISPSLDKDVPAWVRYIRRLGFGSLVLGVARLIPTNYFWWQISAIWCAGGFFIIDACFEKWRRSTKALALVLILAAEMAYSFASNVFASPRMDLQAYSPPGDYAPGTEIGGIAWDEHFRDLRVAVSNPSNEEYEHLDMTITPDQWVHRTAILEDAGGGCRVTPLESNAVYFAKPPIKTSTAQTFSAVRTGDSGEVYDNVGNIFIPTFFKDGIRLRCQSIPSHSTVKLVLALVQFRGAENKGLLTEPAKNGPPGGIGISVTGLKGADDWRELLDPKPASKTAKAKGSYVMGQRPYSLLRTILIN